MINHPDLSVLAKVAKEWSDYIPAIVSALVTWLVVGRAARKLAAMQYTRSVFDAWLTIDTKLLDNQELLRKYHAVAGHATGDDPEKVTMAFMVLNPLRSIHIGIEKGYLRRRDYPSLNANLKRVLEDPIVFSLSQSELLEESFRRLCRRLAGRAARPRSLIRISACAKTASVYINLALESLCIAVRKLSRYRF